MKTNILVTAAGLSDQDLLARLSVLAGREKVEKTKLGAATKPRPCRSIRSGTDKTHPSPHPPRSSATSALNALRPTVEPN